jgi:DNA-binding MarR family transcriptional regulator
MGRREPAIASQAEEIVALVRALRRDLLRNPAEDAENAGLTGPQVSVMACLVSKGPTTLTEVSRTLGMSHSTASGIVDRLQARGLVRRAQDPADQRRTRLIVTDRVTRYVQDLQAGPSGRLAAVLAKVTPREREAIRSGLKLLSSLLRSRPSD